MNDTTPDEKLFDQLRKWLVEKGFKVTEINEMVEIGEPYEETVLLKWKVHHPKAIAATYCHIHDNVFELSRNYGFPDEPLRSVKSMFEWMIDFYDLKENN